jgi:ArsR family transcriptional regulator, arsenate/arsenite/antimonite-responsive transcriptional repressor / arsenate reductase (thioredoxin)
MYYRSVASAPPHRAAVRPPAFLTLAGHPVRWQLLRELAVSDLRVWELTAHLGERQSLVSYHLGLMREAGLVSARRSSADRRDTYYSADLRRCAELLGNAGASVHPGLQLEPSFPVSVEGLSGRVLFLCTGNSARSQIAEALLQRTAPHRVEAFSAGSHPSRVHPNAIRVMRALGIDPSGRRAKDLNEFIDQRFDCVVTVCDRVREVCPDFPAAARMIHWSLADPAESGANVVATYPAFARTADELASRIPFLVHLLVNGGLMQAN